ncbi:MAG: hypothetical protein ACOCV3_00305 [Halanaerobiales bacterium]
MSFAYGHKENGSMFSHMAIMYANALYRRNFVREGYKAWNSIYQHCLDFDKSRIYPGIPEYINKRGRGMYSYLTGSVSWLLLTMVTEVFGVKGEYGDLELEPKLIKEQFDSRGVAKIRFNFARKKFNIEYHNENFQDYGDYKISSLYLNGEEIYTDLFDNYVIISKEIISQVKKKE